MQMAVVARPVWRGGWSLRALGALAGLALGGLLLIWAGPPADPQLTLIFVGAVLAAGLALGLFAAASELITLLDHRIGGPPMSQVDLLASEALAPLAVAAWALQARAGDNGLAAVGGGLLALLAVVRSAVNVGT